MQGAKKKSLCGLAPLRAKNKISQRRKVQACFYALTIRHGGQEKNSTRRIKKIAPRNAAGQAAKAQRRKEIRGRREACLR
jgi:hypothetical protein